MFNRPIGRIGGCAEPEMEKIRRLGSKSEPMDSNEIQELETSLKRVTQRLADGISIHRDNLQSLLESMDGIYRRFEGTFIEHYDLSSLFFQARMQVERSLVKLECGFAVDKKTGKFIAK